MGIRVTYTYRCGHCGAEETSAIEWGGFDPPPNPCPPDGWEVLNGRYVCPRHEVVVMPKGTMGTIEPGLMTNLEGREWSIPTGWRKFRVVEESGIVRCAPPGRRDS